MSRRLVLWRHGRTAWNAQGRAQGQRDVPLDDVGVGQAREAASRLASLMPAALVSSDLRRAADTAAELARLTGLDVGYDRRLREVDFGEREGLTLEESFARFPDETSRWLRADDVRFPGGETYRETAERFADALADIAGFLDNVPNQLAEPIRDLPPEERLVTLVLGYLLAPLFLVVPLMVSAVLAADAFAGEKERRTLESLLHLPISDRDLFVAKLLGAYGPAVVISWVGFVAFAVVSNTVAWPVMHRVFVPTALWAVMIVWVAPAVAALGLGVMVRVSARAKSTQEANQLGGAVILPLIFLAVGQSSGLLLLDLPVALALGGVVWFVALWLIGRGARRFTRDALAARL